MWFESDSARVLLPIVNLEVYLTRAVIIRFRQRRNFKGKIKYGGLEMSDEMVALFI